MFLFQYPNFSVLLSLFSLFALCVFLHIPKIFLEYVYFEKKFRPRPRKLSPLSRFFPSPSLLFSFPLSLPISLSSPLFPFHPNSLGYDFFFLLLSCTIMYSHDSRSMIWGARVQKLFEATPIGTQWQFSYFVSVLESEIHPAFGSHH